MTLPVRASLDAIAHTTALQRLIDQVRTDSQALLDLIDIIVKVARAIPGLVTVERQALGLTTDSVAMIDDWREAHIKRRERDHTRRRPTRSRSWRDPDSLEPCLGDRLLHDAKRFRLGDDLAECCLSRRR